MIYFILFGVAVCMTFLGHPLGAAFVWTAGVALIHAVEEFVGQIWKYFGRLVGSNWLQQMGDSGLILIVAPALVFQIVGAAKAFLAVPNAPHPFYLALLIGARLGDALFSHVLPTSYQRQEVNPGLGSAIVYGADALLLLFLWQDILWSAARESIAGFVVGAGFFLAVLPVLKFSRLVKD
jgi:hypothetical protein